MSKFHRLNQLWLLFASLLLELIREPGVLFWGIAFPLLMSLGLGFAFTKKAEVIRKVAVIKVSETTVRDSSAVYSFL
jgi:ABC-2 type transport system permease protein